MLLKLLSSLGSDTYDPFVISLMDLGDIGLKLKSLSIPVFTIGARRGLFSLANFIYLIRLLKSLRPDIVQTWMYHADLLGGLAAKLSGCHKIIWGLRHSDLSLKHNKTSTILVAKLCALISSWLPTLIISCSSTAKEAHEKFGYVGNKIIVIPNGFSVDQFSPSTTHYKSVRNELGMSSSTPIVGLVARFDPLKNHSGFIKAASIVSTLLPSVHFVLVGSGVDYDNHELIQQIRSANLQASFHLLGYRSDIPRLMSSFDVLASPSVGEGFSNSIGEAMASGVICVVTNVGDSAFIVGDTGFVVENLDMTSFAQAILSVLKLPPDESLSNSLNARSRISDLFSLPVVVSRFESVYQSLIL